jgi:membrane-bound ClpP family serine protease
MTKTNFFKTRSIKIFLTGFVLALVATIIIVLEINLPYTGWLWWTGFVICLVGTILVIRDVTGISKKRN